VDSLSPEKRSALMAAVRANGTKPEMLVRRLAHGMGYRFRLHRNNLPGRPDLVFPKRRSAILVHGCFWHQHTGCLRGRLPKSKLDYWGPKLAGNIERDRVCIAALHASGWRVMVAWECEMKDIQRLRRRLSEFLGPVASAPARSIRS
jgi:DNA mismatch endonuclease, patch repair protein